MSTDTQLQEKYQMLLPHLDEKSARLFLASEAKSMGRGAKVKVAKLAGVSRARINMGIKELESGIKSSTTDKVKKIRRSGGGRKSREESQPGIVEALERIVNPHTLGDPMSPLLWTSKSLRKIQLELKEQNYNVGHVTIGEILKSKGYSLQGNKKTHEGGTIADRDEQFEYINQAALSFMKEGLPVISVDCKKKELIGNFKNGGVEWHKKGEAPNVKVYDFIDKDLGKAVPYGVYDVAKNQGWVNVGISKDTAEFAVNSIRTWWQQMGKEQYGLAKQLLITADGGGSNSSRSRLWKKELQLFATETGLDIKVCHFPPGTSKWNKIEHRLFSFISKNWRGKPLESLEVIVNLIANTTTQTGLKVKAMADKRQYEKGLKVTEEELKNIKLERDTFRGDWNYKIRP
ncbi:MAG: ISAzo13 family transposase [Bacteroidales bacterium]|nr:ISAzo13 family transposase [Bacteroidales bacterium]